MSDRAAARNAGGGTKSQSARAAMARLIGVGQAGAKPCDPGEGTQACSDCLLDCFLDNMDDVDAMLRCNETECNFPSGNAGNPASYMVPLVMAVVRAQR